MDSPRQKITSAIQLLGELQSTSVLSSSSLYKSKPLGPQDQDDYINAVAKLETELEALELLDCLQAIETANGRVRNVRWGPRTLDLDILMYGNETIHNDRLTIPHPEIMNRSFVLIPMAEIDPACVIPGKGLLSDLISGIPQDDLERLQ